MNGALTRALQRAAHSADLPNSVLAALDAADPSWRQDPQERRWWATHNAYRQWLDAHDGEHPSAEAGAAGLHRWASHQSDHTLTLQQRTALRHLPGWSRTADSPEWESARQHIKALLDAGTTVSDNRVHPESLVASTKAVHVQTVGTAARRRQLLTVLTFAVQTGRLPEHHEPGSRWNQHISDDLHAILPPHLFTQPRLIVQHHLERRTTLHALHEAGLPHDEATLAAENAWHRRHTALASRGLLTAADTKALLTD